MTLIRLESVSLEYGEQILLRQADLAVEPGERVCLVGRNGTGKTSLLALLAGEREPDRGAIERRPGLSVAWVAQDLPEPRDQSVFEAVAEGLSAVGRLVEEYERRARLPLGDAGLADLESLQRRIEAGGGWRIEQRVEAVLTALRLPGERPLATLSGGWRRRVSLARALVAEPDLLLLDEPTNHLDLGTIEWLEQRLAAFTGSILFVTHDRRFLERLATRIVDLDRGRLTSWPGDYRRYLEGKEKALLEEADRNDRFDRKLAREEAWIREGIKARRTRNEGRVRALRSLREERAARTSRIPRARVHIDGAEESGRRVIEVAHLTHGFGARELIEDFSIEVLRGDRLGIIGNNGVGKSTLLRLLLGELAPDEGTVRLGTQLEVAYFDQLRETLDPDKTVADNVGGGRDYVRIGGRERHIVGYLEGFLFDAARALTPVKVLSGGERNRVILARLFTRPSNLLVLDEPTNDLDIETLEVLEERLSGYEGTVLLVSHDREFLDNVVTRALVFEEEGLVEHAGGYGDWLSRGRRLAQVDERAAPASASGGRRQGRRRPVASAGKLSYHLQRELDTLPERIEALEREIETLERETGSSGFYAQPYERVQGVLERLTAAQRRLDEAIARWSELEDRREAGGASD